MKSPFSEMLSGHPLAQLRMVLAEIPSENSWNQAQELVEAWSATGEDLDLVMSYLESHISQWKEEMLVCSTPYRYEDLGRLYRVFRPQQRIRRRQLGRLLSQMPNLTQIDLRGRSMGAKGIEMLLQVPTLDQVHTLDLRNTELNSEAVVQLCKARNLQNVRVLRLGDNPFDNVGAKALERTQAFPHLRELHLQGCSSIRFFHPKASLSSLEVLDMSACSMLSRFTLKTEFSHLREFRLTRNNWLTTLDFLDSLPGLKVLDISGGSLQEVHFPRESRNLTHVKLNACWNLREIQGLENLDSLRSLSLQNCYNLQRIPELYLLELIEEVLHESSSVFRDENGDWNIAVDLNDDFFQ
jgi:Leucine-rich repeat (LRR) protein